MYMEKFSGHCDAGVFSRCTINTLLQIKRLAKQNNRTVLIMPFNGCTCSLFQNCVVHTAKVCHFLFALLCGHSHICCRTDSWHV